MGIVGDFNEQQRAHRAIPLALAATGEPGLEVAWVPTDSITGEDALAELNGIWCAPGMPYRDAEGAMRAIRHARLTRTPFLGTSAGFQYALLEYARDALGLSAAEHQKTNPKASMPLISPLGCALAGVRARVKLLHGSMIRSAYGAAEAVEEYHCSFGLNGVTAACWKAATCTWRPPTTRARSAPWNWTATRSLWRLLSSRSCTHCKWAGLRTRWWHRS